MDLLPVGVHPSWLGRGVGGGEAGWGGGGGGAGRDGRRARLPLLPPGADFMKHYAKY